MQHPKPVPDCLRPDPTRYFKRHLTAHHLALLPPKQLPVACPLSPTCFPQVSPSVASAAPPPTPHLCLNQPSSCFALLILPDPTEYFERHPTAHNPALLPPKQLPVACPIALHPHSPALTDPTEYFERYPTAHILASSDDLSPSNPKGDDGLEQTDAIHSAMNIGGRRFFDFWVMRWVLRSLGLAELAGANRRHPQRRECRCVRLVAACRAGIIRPAHRRAGSPHVRM